MVATRLRWRGRLLSFGGALACALALLGGSAHATESIPVESGSLLRSSAAHSVNQSASEHDKVITYGGWQYVLYWLRPNERGVTYLALDRSSAEVLIPETISFSRTENRQVLAAGADRSAAPSLGVSPIDGRLHISWSTLGGTHHYAMSSTRCLTQARLSSCTFGADGQQSRSATERAMFEPQYFNDHAGNLYFGYNSGSASSSTYYLNRYDNRGAWTSLGKIIDGSVGRYDPDGAEGGERSLGEAEERVVLVDGFHFDKRERLIVTWAYREYYPERREAPTPEPLLRTHDLYYAYSDDVGRTWKNNAGSTIGTAESDPITIADAGTTMMIGIPAGWYRYAPARMELDSDGQPHVIMPSSDVRTWDPAFAHYRDQHIWRTMDGAWHSTWMDAAEAGTDVPIAGSMLLDDADSIYYVTARNRLGWYPFNYTPEAELPSGNFFINEREYLTITPATEATAIVTTGRLGKTIGLGTRDTKTLRVTLRNATRLTRVLVAWTTDEAEGWSLARSESFTINARERSFTTHTFTIRDADWRGTIQKLQLDFSGAPVGEGNIDIDEIMLSNTERAEKYWVFSSNSQTVVAKEASPNVGWATWSEYELFPGWFELPLEEVSLAYGDTAFEIDEGAYEVTGKLDFAVVQQERPGSASVNVYDFEVAGDEIVKNWSFPNDVMGWTALSLVTSFGWASDSGTGALSGTLSGENSAVVSPDDLRRTLGGTNDTVHLRLKNTTASPFARIWFKVGSDTTWRLAQSAQFEITPNSGYTWYTINMSGLSGWTRGTLKQLRIDPSEEAEVTTGSFKIDRIYIEPN